MAEKKFFVDINLQGNKLTNPVVGSNSSMTAEGSFQYNAGRLEYYNGTSVQEVANLADIAAVTGGLIFQGGYDPTTNTPDITDGSALKGFFWVATAAGTFLGEAVQVGDSIVAKVDNASTTLSDWLILQGNVVIATDSVDGISRLATQTEANDGTEGGAVVITPATLQGKIDAQVTPEINSKVSKSGDTMSGDLSMGNNDITSVNTFQSYIVTTENLQSAGSAVLLYSNINAQGTNKITDLPTPTDGGDAANKTYVDGQVATALPLAGGTMENNFAMGGYSITDLYSTVNDADGNAANIGLVKQLATDAENNANAYTDDAIAQEVTDRNNAIKEQSYSQTIAPADWQFNTTPPFYYVDITHNLGNFINVSTFAKDQYGNYWPAEFSGEYNPTYPGAYGIYSNIAPTYDVLININKAGGNL